MPGAEILITKKAKKAEKMFGYKIIQWASDGNKGTHSKNDIS